MPRRMMKRTQPQAVLAAIARREWLLQMLALGAAGCRREDRAYSRGNTLIVGVDGYPDERPLGVDEYAETLVFLPLVRINERGDREPCLATDWTHSADFVEWTYRLRPGVRWHDGRPVTADDVKFTIDLHALPDDRAYKLVGTECTVHDAFTFTVRGTSWGYGDATDTYMSIHPKHLLKDLDPHKFYEWDFWLRPVGNGPYRYLRYQPGTMVELEANPDYYGRRPKIERIVLKFTRGASLTELLAGNVDVIQTNGDQARMEAIANDPRFQTYWGAPSSSNFGAIVWQNEHPLFRDGEVRLALSLAINRRELLQVLHLPSFSLVDGVYTERQLRRGETSEPRYDPAEARRLLDASGWRLRSQDSVRERNGQVFRFTALTQVGTSATDAALYAQDQLHDLGVRMELQPLERGVLQSRLKAREFEAAVCNSSIAGALGGRLRGFFGEQSSGYQNPQLMRLFDRLATAADPDVVDEIYREISDLLRKDQPIVFLYRPARANVVHRRLKGLSAPWRSDPLRFTEDLWLENQP